MTGVYSSAENALLNISKDTVVPLLGCSVYSAIILLDDFSNGLLLHYIASGYKRTSIICAKFIHYILGCSFLLLVYPFLCISFTAIVRGIETSFVLVLWQFILVFIKSLPLYFGIVGLFFLVAILLQNATIAIAISKIKKFPYETLAKRGFRSIKTADQLDALIEKRAIAKGVKYLFIDEIQNVAGFEEVINGFREEEEYSIFITGSNFYLLSGELTTKLTGRYLEFELYTLSFDEYLGMKTFLGKAIQTELTNEFDLYILEGGFPKALQYEDEDKQAYIQGVIREIFEKDIKKRVKIRKVSVFETVQSYIINNFGATMSLTNILCDLHKNGCGIKRETLYRYIRILEDAKIIYSCKRFDLKSRKSIAGEQKYYLADLGFYYAMNTDKRINYGPAMEFDSTPKWNPAY